MEKDLLSFFGQKNKDGRWPSLPYMYGNQSSHSAAVMIAME